MVNGLRGTAHHFAWQVQHLESLGAACGQRSPRDRAPFCVAGAALSAPDAAFAWQVQLILHDSSHSIHLTQLTSQNSLTLCHTNQLTQLISHKLLSHKLILHNSSHTTHFTQLISLNSTPSTHLTQLNSHTHTLISHNFTHTLIQLISRNLTDTNSSHIPHLIQLIPHKSSHTTHLTQLISHNSPSLNLHSTSLTQLISTHLTQLILHNSS